MLKLLQRRGRLDPDLVVEHPSESLVGVESLGLTSVAVQGENQESVQPLAERVPRRQCLDLADHVAMASTAQVGLDSILQTAQAQLFEVAASTWAKGSENSASAGPRHNSSAAERSAAAVASPVSSAALLRCASVEAAQVECVRLDLDPIAGRLRHEHAGGSTFRRCDT